jgi:putative hydrolase of the HAD superfamily
MSGHPAIGALRGQYRAVVFDLFGTLVDFSIQAYDALLAAMADALAVPVDDFVARWAASYPLQERGALPGVEAAIERALLSGTRPSAERCAAAAALWMDFQRGLLVPRDGTVETLSGLRAAGMAVGVLSNCPAEVASLWAESPLSPLVDAAVFSCTIRRTKPSPEAYEHMCVRLGVRPTDCLYIGDGGSDELRGATATGMTAVCLRPEGEDPQNATRLGRGLWRGPTITRLPDIFILLSTNERVPYG